MTRPRIKAPEPGQTARRPDAARAMRKHKFIARRRADHQAAHLQRLSRDYGRTLRGR